MKKIFRMALVFALAGATLMYTGCSKDYSEDINKLDSDISSLKSDYTALSNELATLKSGVASLEAAYKAADTALENKLAGQISDLQKNLNGKIGEIENAIDSKADKAAVEKAIADLRAEATAAAEELQETLNDAIADLQGEVNEALEEAQKNLDDAMAAFSNELRSIVFVPELYYAGIEATEYSYAVLFPYELKAIEKEAKFRDKKTNVLYTFPVPAADEGIAVLTNKKNQYPWQAEDIKSYSIGESAVAQYNLNPSAFDVANAEWKLNGYDKKYVVKDEEAPAEPETWEIVFDGIKNNAGVADVTYHIENPMFLNGLIETYYKSIMTYLFSENESGELELNDDPLNIAAEVEEILDSIDGPEAYDAIVALIARELGKVNGTVSVMNLEASIKDSDKVIASDYEAIVSDYEMLEWLAFSSKNTYVTSTNKEVACAIADDNAKHLYHFADTAVVNAPSVPVYYNCGSFDLKPLVNVHVLDSEGGYEATLADLQKKYGEDITMDFELVPYTIGGHKTVESAYGAIEDGVFFPAYVKNLEDAEAGKPYTSTLCGTDGKGISAVGRLPLVFVTLKDGDKTLLHGYFVIEITEEELKEEATVIDLKDFGAFPYICAVQSGETKWYEYSDNVLEELGVSYNKMINKYQVMNVDGELEAIEPGTHNLQVLVLDEEGKYVAPEKKLGSLKYIVDATGNGINDKFIWSFNKAQADRWENPQEVYVLFQAGAYEKVYFKFTAAIADKAEVTYGKINPAYWFEDVEAGVQNTVRANVLVPQITDDNVTNFTKDIDDYFIGNKLQVKLAEESEEVYGKYFDGEGEDELTTTYTYKFAEEQPVIDGKPLYVSADGLTLRLPQDKDGDGEYDTDADGNYINGSDIATIKGTSIKYNTTYWAKYLLNLWGKEETAVENMLYANIQVDYTAGDGEECVIAEGSDVFHIRFIRPLSVVEKASDDLADAIPGGDVIYLGNLVNAIDWNDNEPDQLWSFVKKDAKVPNKNGDTPKATVDGFYADTYKTAAGNDIIWFNYYGFKTITVNADKVETDQTGEWLPLKEVNAAAKAYLAQLNGDKFEEVAGGKTAELTANTTSPFQIPGLTDYVFFYENNMGVVKDFQLKVPVSIEYSWGTLKAKVIIPVKHTYDEPTTPETPAGE